MSIIEISRCTTPTEVVSVYAVKNQTINLISKFGESLLEDLIYELILQKLNSFDLTHNQDIQLKENVI